MIHFISDHFIAPLRCGLLFDSSENKVSQAALPILCCLGLIFLGIFPIPGNTVLLAGAVIAAAYCYEPPLGEPFVLPKLRPLFSPPSELLLNIRILRGDPLPEDAPRGIKGGDSWLSADLQLLESSIAIVQWLRDMPPRTLASFGQFFQAYERGDRSLTSSPLRAALSDIFPIDQKGTDPANLLSFILKLSPREFKGCVSKTVFYNSPVQGGSPSMEIKEEQLSLISLPIQGVSPRLETMFHSFWNVRHPIGLTRTEVGLDGEVRVYRANRIERRFVTAPLELWFKIARFEKTVQKSIFHEVPFLQSIFPPIQMGILKNPAPVWIPSEIEIYPLRGASKKYRLNAFLVHEGAFPQEDRVKAYRYKEGVLYGCHHQWINKIPRSSEREILSQAYLLHYEPL